MNTASSPDPVLCPRCGHPMQLAEEIPGAAGPIALRYVCGCPPDGVHHVTIHTGDKTRKTHAH